MGIESKIKRGFFKIGENKFYIGTAKEFYRRMEMRKKFGMRKGGTLGEVYESQVDGRKKK